MRLHRNWHRTRKQTTRGCYEKWVTKEEAEGRSHPYSVGQKKKKEGGKAGRIGEEWTGKRKARQKEGGKEFAFAELVSRLASVLLCSN